MTSTIYRKILNFFTIIVVASATMMLSATAQEDGVIATVGDRNITTQELDLAVERLGAQFGNIPDEEKRKNVLNSMIDFTVLAQLAEKQGLDKDPETIKTLADLRLQALHNAYFKREIEPKVTQEILQQAYEAEIEGKEPEKEVKARHILLEEEEEAVAVIAELEGGADFIELAKEKSTGPSAPQGGDLGFFGAGRMVPEFEKAAFDMEPGSYTKEPVKTQFGYHVIKVEETRDKPLPTFEELEGRLRQAALAKAYSDTVRVQRDTVSIEILDESLKQ